MDFRYFRLTFHRICNAFRSAALTGTVNFENIVQMYRLWRAIDRRAAGRVRSGAPRVGSVLLALWAAQTIAAMPSPARTPDDVAAREWRLHGRDSREQRFSPLTRIHRGNVAGLGIAFTFDDFVVRGRTHRGVQATPLFADGLLYFTGPWSVVYALLGEQYIAVLAGLGGAMNARFHPGFAALSRRNHERLFVLKLGGRTPELPPLLEPAVLQPLVEGLANDDATLALGARRFAQYCARCHAQGSAPNGYPDLWNLPPSIHEAFVAIVRDGPLSPMGMPGFADALGDGEIRAIQAFIVADQARRRHAAPLPVRASADSSSGEHR